MLRQALAAVRDVITPGLGLAVAFIGFGVVSANMIASAESQTKSRTFIGELSSSAFETAAENNQEVVIRYSPGGSGASAMALSKVRAVVIDGKCLSACAWAFVSSETACFTKRASFGFHAAYDPGTGQAMPAATTYWLETVRPSLRPQLAALQTSPGIITISASEMRRHYADRACDATTRTN